MITKTWRLIKSGPGSAAWNMAVDEALLHRFQKDDLPIIRFYGWEPALSFGRYSNVQSCLDMQKVNEQGIAYVRRITGGGVLVHGGDISYALILPRTLENISGVKEAYRHLCSFLISFYQDLGEEAFFASELAYEEKKSEVCLAGKEAYDIMINGSKIGGNAQRYTRDVIFQHGSIPFKRYAQEHERLFLSGSGLDEAATLEGFGHAFAYEELVSMLEKSFKESFGADMICGDLRSEEVSLAQTLLQEKYSQQRWNINAKRYQAV